MNPEIKYRVVEDVTQWMTHAQVARSFVFKERGFQVAPIDLRAGAMACGAKVSKENIKEGPAKFVSCQACKSVMEPFRAERVES